MQRIKPHAVLLASPGLGHLVPVLELGNRLLTLHGFDVTIFLACTASFPTQSQLLGLSPSPQLLKHVVKLPPVDISGLLNPTDTILTRIILMMRQSRPALRSAIAALERRPTVLIVDFFGTDALGIADELGMRKYAYIPCSAWFVALTAHVPTVDEENKGAALVSRRQPLRIPGCTAVRYEETFSPLLDRTTRSYREYVEIGAALSRVDGIFVNTWNDLEPVSIEALKGDGIWGRLTKVPVHPVGPVVRTSRISGPTGGESDWLDAQPAESVIFVSFGSGGTLSAPQMEELAWGLELSQQRFIWVVRPPIENDSAAVVLTIGSGDGDGDGDGTPDYLPEGFLSRTQGLGLVIPMWAPQEEILSHPAVGGFLSHCGWNSALESMVNGVPMIAWPLYAEQPMNAALLAEEIGVALRPEVLPAEGVVGRKEVERMIRKIMVEKEGETIRERAKEMKRSAIEALSKGGTSYSALARVANDCKNWVHAADE